jgi:hypothetical protein
MDNTIAFDRPDKDSAFLTFVAREFRQRGTPLRKRLGTKEYAAKVVAELGLRIPRKFRLLDDINALKPRYLKDRVVLKYAKGWSARGVMLLEKVSRNRYFDYMSLRELTIADIVRQQSLVAKSFSDDSPSWIVEEFLQPAQAYGAIPFDYKFYVFGQQIGLIVQVDRNSSPPRVALFDGVFHPLNEGADYVLCSENNQRGLHSIPPHAAELQWWAMKLASITDAPFVSIDMYDTPSGPVFGEFTFSPGGTHKRMFKFSASLIDHFDELFALAEKHLESDGEEASDCTISDTTAYLDLLRTSDYMAVREAVSVPEDFYRVCSGIAYNQGSRGALRLKEHYAEQGDKLMVPLQKAICRMLEQGWQAIRAQLQERANEGKAEQ